MKSPKLPIPPAAEQPRMSWRMQVMFWILAILVLVLFLVVFSSVLLPFLAGMILAYFLDPVADRLERIGFSRLWAAVTILIVFVLLLVVGLAIVGPIMANQLADFISNVPDYFARLRGLVTSVDIEWLSSRVGIEPQGLEEGISSIFSGGADIMTGLLSSLWSGGRALIDIVGLLVVTPVVAFYMLVDWDRMIARVDELIPRDNVATVRRLAREVDNSVAGFVRGQGTLCLILGTYYAIGLTLAGLNFGLLIGMFAGLISFIPYVGSLTGLVLAVGVALVQFWPEWQMVALVAAIFFSGQFIEGNILQPNLVGKSVGLHPVWLMFALFAFGYLFGFVGLLVAVPAAAAVAVLVRFAIERYEASALYGGTQTPRKPL
ncbi:AI-2E family transporter [Aliihoeflea aestuarii]|uniref:AI-2E family transporter n=1 Tax=Aliihoeflea aestuarii TaxID=453840 RepID=UPI002095A571|nr:AI-2E family transporter [Aliihoeflea aestuarii]